MAPITGLLGLMGGAGLAGIFMGNDHDHDHYHDADARENQYRDLNSLTTRSAIFVLNNTASLGSLPSEMRHKDLHVMASQDETNGTAVFHQPGWANQRTGVLSGYPTIGHGGLMGGDFSIPNPNEGAEEPLKGTWISVHESADDHTKAGFETLKAVVEADKPAMTAEEILHLILLVSKHDNATETQ
ncbi:hypothetical protein LTR36_001573 [Oleoguttula mirabilis]|uniref:Uncharacterized protein n=1 Tax=Oleoguttula mirabilis TaxID=1507867 RepID=A0AAV9JP84_9PEZI|nr:hypothetical protein LTR36_001573 [Oleoguttula mirabilis]